jgi:hypothetical protein
MTLSTGRNGWRQIIANDKAFKKYRLEAKQADPIKLSQKGLQQIENRLDKPSAPQAAMVYEILRDRERLDAGVSRQRSRLRTA